MKKIKRIFLRAFLVVEALIFTSLYCFGNQGMVAQCRVRETNNALEAEVTALCTEVATLEHELAQWHSDSFYKEKAARERLQMARSDDIVFCCDKNVGRTV